MSKKKLCTILAVVVTVCALVSLVSAEVTIYASLRDGAPLPWGMLLMPMITIFCAVMVWKGVREVEN